VVGFVLARIVTTELADVNAVDLGGQITLAYLQTEKHAHENLHRLGSACRQSLPNN
jgi:hypothetical protein